MNQGLVVAGICKQYGNTPALDGISFDVHPAEVIALLGPSGCGKSTLLSIIAGLEQADCGQIHWNNQPVDTIPAHQRRFGLMFQDYMLFPHMNVADNIAFGLRMKAKKPEQTEEQVRTMLAQVGLEGYENRNVSTLSGGEQQRVALARALAPKPRLLMLDEPLGSLDRVLREHLMVELRTLLLSMQQTAIYVTHDQEEAFALADRIVVMQHGRVAQIGKPQEIYRQPASEFVASFLGFENLFTAEVINAAGQSQLVSPWGRFPISTQKSGAVRVLLRPDQVALRDEQPFFLTGQVVDRSFRGSLCRLHIKSNNHILSFEFPSVTQLPRSGESIQLYFNPEHAFQILS